MVLRARLVEIGRPNTRKRVETINCGFIGYGNMGSIIVNSMLRDGAVRPDQVVIYNRTPGKIDELQSLYPGIVIAGSASEAAAMSDILFICTLSRAMPEVLRTISGALRSSAHLVMISKAVPLKDLESMFDGPVSIVIPSVTMGSGRGVTLMCHSTRTDMARREALKGLFSRSTMVREVDENDIEAASDLTSTSPAFIAEMMDQWADTIAKGGRITTKEAREMLYETMLGTAMLLADNGMSSQKVKELVATKGGITEQGLIVLEKELPELYGHVFAATMKKRNEIWKQGQ